MPRALLHPHVRVPNERARLGAAGRAPGGRRHGSRPLHGGGRCRRAQHLLHPGERRPTALRHARAPQGAGRRAARSADRRRGLPGPEGPRAHPGEGGLGRRRLRDAQPDQRARAVAPLHRGGPGDGDPRRPGARVGHQPLARARRGARAALCRLGEHPDRLRQLVRLLHRAGRARARGEPRRSTTSSPRSSCWPSAASPR